MTVTGEAPGQALGVDHSSLVQQYLGGGSALLRRGQRPYPAKTVRRKPPLWIRGNQNAEVRIWPSSRSRSGAAGKARPSPQQ